MFSREKFRLIAVFTLVVFTCFTLTLNYSYSQEENPLLKAQGLYKQGNFIEAVKVLEAFIEKIKGSPSENKRLAEANYLLARIYYEAGEDARVVEYMKQAVEAYPEIGKEEDNLDFKTRLERVREEWLKTHAESKETAQIATTKTDDTTTALPQIREKEKPVPQAKKKKKFPWLPVIAGALLVGVIIYFVAHKKSKYKLTVSLGEGVQGTPANGTHVYKKGDSVSYSYSLSASSYKDLTVLLNGNIVPASGDLKMTGDFSLSASATIREATFTNGVLTVKGTRYELASIPAGTFQMGSNSLEASENEQPPHSVQISKGFWMGKTEVTQGLWQAVMGGNPSYFKKGETYPVEFVSWDECQSFIQTLNQMLGENKFRLPTEAEWEYACRAGTTGDRYGDLNAIAWYVDNSGDATHPVGQKQINSWGLYDMLGNVWEWCQDLYDANYYKYSPSLDPLGPSTGEFRVLRGGSWIGQAARVRSPVRPLTSPGIRVNSLGLRLARTEG